MKQLIIAVFLVCGITACENKKPTEEKVKVKDTVLTITETHYTEDDIAVDTTIKNRDTSGAHAATATKRKK